MARDHPDPADSGGLLLRQRRRVVVVRRGLDRADGADVEERIPSGTMAAGAATRPER